MLANNCLTWMWRHSWSMLVDYENTINTCYSSCWRTSEWRSTRIHKIIDYLSINSTICWENFTASAGPTYSVWECKSHFAYLVWDHIKESWNHTISFSMLQQMRICIPSKQQKTDLCPIGKASQMSPSSLIAHINAALSVDGEVHKEASWKKRNSQRHRSKNFHSLIQNLQ